MVAEKPAKAATTLCLHACTHEQRIKKDAVLQKWPADVQHQIAAVVAHKAGDMFRLAILHFDDLRECRTYMALQEASRALPPTSNETYAHTLKDIPEEYIEDALRFFH
jgi:hypothetical protein